MSQSNAADKVVQLSEVPKTGAPDTAPPAPPESTSRANRALTVLRRLIITLDLDTLLGDFLNAVSEEVPVDGISYDNPDSETSMRFGRDALQTCSYSLTLEKEYLGSLKFMRRTPFDDSEMQTLEDLLCLVVHPLRNALRYQAALRSAHVDPLTQLPNRQALAHQTRREIGLADRHGTPLAYMLIDIDNFKSINDRFGHLVGDEALKRVAQILVSKIRRTELVFRLGGDEFVVLLSNTGAEGARLAAERIRTALADCELPVGQDRSIRPTVSIGVSQLTAGEDPDALFSRTDEAMYDAKARGRNRVCTA